MLSFKTPVLGNKRMSGDHPNYSITGDLLSLKPSAKTGVKNFNGVNNNNDNTG